MRMGIGSPSLAMHVSMLQVSNEERGQDPDEERGGEPQPVVRMELHFRQEIAERNAQENPSRKRERRGKQDVLVDNVLNAEIERGRAERTHQRVTDIGQVAGAF